MESSMGRGGQPGLLRVWSDQVIGTISEVTVQVKRGAEIKKWFSLENIL